MSKNYKRIFTFTLIISLFVFALFVFIYRDLTIRQASAALEEHARIIADSLFRYEKSASFEYVKLAAASNHYRQVSVHDHIGTEFIRFEQNQEDKTDRFLSRIGLLPVYPLKKTITYQNQNIGEITVAWQNRMVFVCCYIFLCLVLSFIAAWFFVNLMVAKATLEERVMERTADLKESETRLRLSEERLEMALAGANDGIWDWNLEDDTVHFDARYYTMVGYEPEEFPGSVEEWEKRIHPGDLARVRKSVQDYLSGKIRTYSQDYRFLNQTGEYQWVRARGKIAVYDEKNRPSRFIGTHSDIHEHKLLEKARDDAYAIINSSQSVAFIWKNEPGWPVEFVTENIRKEFGYHPEELLSGTISYDRLIFSEDLDRVTKEVQEFNSRKNGVHFVHTPYRIITKSGDIRWVDDRSHVKRNDEGEITHYHGVILDITGRRQAEEEIRNLRNYLANIIDSMPSILIGVDREGRVTQWNRRAGEATGISQETAQGKRFENVFPRLSSNLDLIRKAILNRQVCSDSRHAREENARMVYEDVTIYPLVANGVEGAVIRVDDVTEQVRLEEMMVQSEKMLSVGGLAAGMAHEINNPLAGMLQTASVMKSRLSDLAMPANLKAAVSVGMTMDQIRAFMETRGILRMVDTIQASGKRVAKIVENMLSFARKTDANISICHPVALMDNTLELAFTDYDLKKQYDFKKIGIVKDYEENLPMIPCEESKIQQVLLNILRNGAQAMQEKNSEKEQAPCFVLGLAKEEDMLRIEIRDNGPGMDKTMQSRIFEPFFTTKPAGVGTGLGLSVSYFIITQNHGGTIDVVSSPGKGTNFIIRLPLVRQG